MVVNRTKSMNSWGYLESMALCGSLVGDKKCTEYNGCTVHYCIVQYNIMYENYTIMHNSDVFNMQSNHIVNNYA